MRKLATIRKIDKIIPIENADKIETAIIDGWNVVIQKDQFKKGDIVIYIEIDSWVPTKIAPFLSKGKEPRSYHNIKGERLKTVKLRGQISQGLIIPNHFKNKNINDDVTEDLEIIKWEPPLSANLKGMAKGNFPTFIKKTDQERCQNLKREIIQAFDNKEIFEISEKIDGSSMTVYNNNLEIGVCSRRINLKLSNEDNTFIKVAHQTNILKCIELIGMNIAIQGELFGEGIQKNREQITGHNFAIFDIFDIDNYRYLLPSERKIIYDKLLNLGFTGTHVKIIDICEIPFRDINNLLLFAEGKNSAGIEREGLVYKSCEREFSFKTISNKYLLKGGI